MNPALADVLSVSQPRPSVWNSSADYLHDPALERNRFRRQLKTFLFVCYYAQRIKVIINNYALY